MVQPAGISTKTGKQRFLVTIKLPEKSLKTASSFVNEMNDALRTARAGELTAQFTLVDSERTRLQRATAGFFTFKEAQTCLQVLKKLGLATNDVSAELEDFGNNKYDPWYESISKAWWPWFAALRNPPPEMPMMKPTNRLDVSEGGKYKEAASGKLGKSDEVDRADARGDENDSVAEEPGEKKGKKRRKKKKVDEGERSED